MPKKIIDIFPPKSPTVFQKGKEQPFSFSPELSPSSSFPEVKKWQMGKKIFFIVGLFLTVTFILLNFIFIKADVEIWPVVEILTLEEKITLDTDILASDFTARVIPGKIFETEKMLSEEFSATGKVLKKAEGIVRLYNSYTTKTEVWRKGTRFVSSEGKLFLSKDIINVPGAAIKNGKIKPSFVDVPIEAAEGGSDYNIGSSHFSIVAYQGTPKYTKYYGESFVRMTGGGEFSQVRAEDLKKAENVLAEKAKKESAEDLKEKIPQDFVFIDKLMETEILEKNSSANSGEVVEKFKFQIKTKSATIAFKKKDIENFAIFSLSAQTPLGKKLYYPSLEIKYPLEVFNLQEGKIILPLNFLIKTYSEIDLNSLKKGLTEKSLEEAKILLENQPEIRRVKINLFPFWRQSIPQSLEKININIKI